MRRECSHISARAVAGSNARQVERVWICTALVLVLLASLHGMNDVNIDY